MSEVERPGVLDEGWYLMSDLDVERELARWRSPDSELPPSNALPLGIRDALEYRNAGNRPDAQGRSLRLVLQVRDALDLVALERKRLVYEPDFHEAPRWRGPGSRPVNVVPLRGPGTAAAAAGPWWKQPEVAALEAEWQEHQTVAGVRVPEPFRSFVFKTVLSLQAAGKEVTATSIADSVERWVPASDAQRIRTALQDANEGP